MRILPFTLLLGACTGSGDWKSADDCRAVSNPDVRDDCFLEVAPAVFRESPEAGEAMLKEVSDPQVRDYILHKITREVDPSSYRYCDQIQTPELAKRCRTLVQRPHLHRELVGQDGAKGGAGGGAGDAPPGGPPPGGAPPGGAPPGGAPPGGAPPGGAPPAGEGLAPADGAKGPPLP